MKGLILKDILNFTNHQGKLYLALVVLYFFTSLQAKDSSFLATVGMIFGISYVIGTFAYDEQVQWNKYVLTMPVTRRDIVTSKYLVSVIAIAVGSIISLPLSFIIDKNISMEKLMIYGLLAVAGIMFIAISMPFVFQFGAEKSRIIMILIIIIPGMAGYTLQRMNVDLIGFVEKNAKTVEIATAVIAVVIYIFSYLLSIFIMEHKEIS